MSRRLAQRDRGSVNQKVELNDKVFSLVSSFEISPTKMESEKMSQSFKHLDSPPDTSLRMNKRFLNMRNSFNL
jgi:hypothetical protein